MPLISARIIKHPRKDRVCPMCYKHIVGETARLYGNAEQGDPLFVLYLHPACVTGKEASRKLQAAQHRIKSDEAICTCQHDIYENILKPGYCMACDKPLRRLC